MKVWIEKPVSEPPERQGWYAVIYPPGIVDCAMFQNGYWHDKEKEETNPTHYLVPIEAHVLTDKELEEIKRKAVNEALDAPNDPYWYWPQCDVDGCEGVSCNGGGCWRETGYWSVCQSHSADFRKGLPQPKMRESAIEREASRNKKDGTLPIPVNNKQP